MTNGCGGWVSHGPDACITGLATAAAGTHGVRGPSQGRLAGPPIAGRVWLTRPVGIDAYRAGTRLERARIRHAQAEPFLVDLEVRHVTRQALPNGKLVSRVGCRVVGTRETLEQLVRLFIIDLG